MSHYALTIDGLPYYALTPDSLPVLAWANSDDEPRGAVPLCVLEMPRGSWSERMRLVDGDLDVDGMTFELHDVRPEQALGYSLVPYDPGIAIGKRWLTYFSRQSAEVDSAVLSASIDDAVTSFDLTASSASAVSGSIPGVLWVDDEAINCASIAGTTVTVASGGRGYYGTKARAHLVDEEFGAIPEVWTAPPSLYRRRVILWRIDATSATATPIWRGYSNRPRLSPNGMSWQLQCEPAWTVDRARPLGLQTAGTHLRGYSTEAIGFGAQMGKRYTIDSTTTTPATAFSTLQELLSWSKSVVEATLPGVGSSGATGVTAAQVDLQIVPGTRRVRLSVQTSDANNNAMVAVCNVFGQLTLGTQSNSNPQYSNCEVELPELALVLPLPYHASSTPTIPVRSVNTLPATFETPDVSNNGPHRTVVRQALIGGAGDNARLVLYPEGSPSSDTGTLRGPSITARYRYFDAKNGNVIDPPRFGNRGAITASGRLALGASVTTTHWLYGLQAIVRDTNGIVRVGFDTRNFDDEVSEDTVVLTESELADRVWNLDGTMTLGDLAVPTLAAEGCCPAIREHGKVGFVAIRNPVATEQVIASFTPADFVVGTRALYEDSPVGVVNTAEIEYGGEKVRLVDQRGVNRYGQGRAVSLKLMGLQLSQGIADARSIASRVLSRIVQVFGEPTSVLKWTTSLYFSDVFLGDIVSVTDSTTPNGAGGRGSSERRCQVIARTIDLAKGTIAWEGIVLPLVYGYAPACKIASISGAALTADTGYVLAGTPDATDYAGFGGTDRGVSTFKAGFGVKLVARDTTTYTYYPGVVDSVDPSTGTITLTAPVPTSPYDWVTAAANDWVDIVFDDYDQPSVTSEQKLYAVCGNGAAHFGGIGVTGDKSRRWGA